MASTQPPMMPKYQYGKMKTAKKSFHQSVTPWAAAVGNNATPPAMGSSSPAAAPHAPKGSPVSIGTAGVPALVASSGTVHPMGNTDQARSVEPRSKLAPGSMSQFDPTVAPVLTTVCAITSSPSKKAWQRSVPEFLHPFSASSSCAENDARHFGLARRPTFAPNEFRRRLYIGVPSATLKILWMNTREQSNSHARRCVQL
mmetsp:Transcript_72897/g.202250  ORF Transcript_72897/g.202250 Transcript_72897/m.202250 type:complete len:200 (+) Transcript_72897:1431-2030(+)